MASSSLTDASRRLHLPDELWLQILPHLDWPTLWHTIRAVNSKFRTEVEKLAITSLLPDFSIALPYSLGSGTRHRWYDVRATITLAFASMNKHNPDFALFKIANVHPSNYRDRALEKWRPMCARGLSPGLDWQVGYSWVELTHRASLTKLVPAEDGAVWCDWREVMGGWFRAQAEMEGKVCARSEGVMRGG